MVSNVPTFFFKFNRAARVKPGHASVVLKCFEGDEFKGRGSRAARATRGCSDRAEAAATARAC